MEKLGSVLIFLIGCLFGLSQISCSGEREVKNDDLEILVYYIANEGFLLERKDTKILIDALFLTGLDKYASPEPSMLNAMIEGDAPFTNVDYILLTHNHPDHFNDSLVFAFMEKHKETVMICPDQVFLQLKSNYRLDQSVENRITSLTPEPGQVMILNFPDLGLKVCRTRHSDTYEVENNAYIMDFDGVKVFHSGDSWKEALDEWKNVNLKAEGIHLALVNGFYAGDGFDLLNEKMDPDQIILIHMKNEHLDMFSDIMAKDTAVFYNSTLFKQSGTSRMFRF